MKIRATLLLLSVIVVPFVVYLAASSHASGLEGETIPPMPPARAARITAAYSLDLSTPDASGSALLAYGYRVGDEFTSANAWINLLSGKLLSPSTGERKTDGVSRPSDRYTVEQVEEPRSVVIRTKQGRVVGRINWKDAPDFVDDRYNSVTWSPKDEVFAFCQTMPGRDSTDGLYVYSIKDRSIRLVLKNLFGLLEWSSDGRYLACVTDSPASQRFDYGIINVLDAKRGYKPVRKTGVLAGYLKFSPSNTKIAFTSRSKDEFGDFDNYKLQVAEIGSGKVQTIAVNRRRIRYIWAGDNALAVQVCDKYARPSLYLKSADGLRSTLLIADPGYSSLEPVAYIPKANRVAYIARKGSFYNNRPSELWTVEPKQRPKRVFPVKVRVER